MKGLRRMWRERIEEVLRQIGQHPAWGVEHCYRVYHQAMSLARGQNVDEEVVFAAAIVHDFGAYPPYRLPGADHAARSAQVAVPFLIDQGFPVQKANVLEGAILGHMYDSEPASSLESRVIHDADVLDFLGAIGIARQLLLVGRPEGFANLSEAAKMARRLAADLPSRLVTEQGRALGITRRQETIRFLDALEQQRAGEAVNQ